MQLIRRYHQPTGRCLVPDKFSIDLFSLSHKPHLLGNRPLPCRL
jgi:hypothetical protein